MIRQIAWLLSDFARDARRGRVYLHVGPVVVGTWNERDAALRNAFEIGRGSTGMR
jgi:hypothetical protein